MVGIYHPPSNSDNSPVAIIVTLLLVVGVVALAVLYILPALRDTEAPKASVTATVPVPEELPKSGF